MTESCEPKEEYVTLIRDDCGNTEFVRYAIAGDGNCGYHAISLWLKKNRSDYYNAVATAEGGSTPMLLHLKETVQYVDRNKDLVKKNCGFSDEALNRAMDRVKRGQWMEAEELSIICCAFNLKAFVYDPDSKSWTLVIPKETATDIIWLYNVPNSHFDLLEPIGYREENTRKKMAMAQMRRRRRARSQPKNRQGGQQRGQQRGQQGKKTGESPCEGCEIQLQSTPNSLKF
jgi:hypothetical protein